VRVRKNARTASDILLRSVREPCRFKNRVVVWISALAASRPT
jgi:hypothetical protein